MTSRAKVSRSSLSSRKPKRRAGLPSTGRPVREAALAEVKDDLSRFLRLAESEEIVITRHGKPAGVLIGFGSEDDWFDYRLENDPRFLQRIEQGRESLRAGRGIRLEDLDSTEHSKPATPAQKTVTTAIRIGRGRGTGRRLAPRRPK